MLRPCAKYNSTANEPNHSFQMLNNKSINCVLYAILLVWIPVLWTDESNVWLKKSNK